MIFVLLALGCGREGDASRERPDGAPSSGSAPPSGDPRDEAQLSEPLDLGHGSPPLVIEPEDVGSLDFPVMLIGKDGVVRQAEDAAALRAILEPEDETVRHVRLFYATDRNREEPGGWTIVEPLLPAAGAFLAAWLFTRLLRRWLREEARAVAYFMGAMAFAAAGGVVFRGTTIALETLRLSRYTDVLYGHGRNPSGTLELGIVLVSIPVQVHEIARIESPSLLRGEVFPDPLRHFVIEKVEALQEETFYAELREGVAESQHREACVFVHGYNNTFAYAAMRLAQIVYDVGFDGAPILYSWPSKGAAALYTYDRENADWSAGNLALFLTDLKTRSGAERIHLMAHSMGSKVATNAVLRAIPAAAEGEEPFFHEIILAAPDIDAETFERFIAPELNQRAERVTLYASERDEALLASVQVNGQRRAGMAGEDIVVIEGMDTIDVSRVAGGHAYIADSGRVLGDLVELVRNALPAEERTTLESRELGEARYWEIVSPR